MRVVHYKILTEILENFQIPEYIYAFEKEKSIPVMARLHTKKNIVISIDIKDFFPSINEEMIRRVMIDAEISNNPARSISELCTYSHFVPQGALTSPKISNIVVAATFGPEVQSYCVEKGLSLSIYADDITVSTDKVFETLDLQSEFLKETISALTGFVEEYGFRINKEKTKVMKPYQRQWVCGSVVNEKVNLKKTERQRLRAIVFNCEKNGLTAEAEKTQSEPFKFASKVLGQLNWYSQLNPDQGIPIKERFKTLVKQERNIDADMVFASVTSLYSG